MTTPGATKVCKVCGIEYPYCHTNIPNQYRWQDVACCPEHAAEYFAKIAAARSQSIDAIPTEFTELLPKPEEVTKDGSDGFADTESSATVSYKPKKKFKKS